MMRQKIPFDTDSSSTGASRSAVERCPSLLFSFLLVSNLLFYVLYRYTVSLSKMKITILCSALLLSQAVAFSPLLDRPATCTHESRRTSALFMGRAAAVRAATKSKTDAKKAKTNALFGKKIIMAVKQGGSPDPSANRALADVIKQAKSNSVPVDVSREAKCAKRDFLSLRATKTGTMLC